MILFNFYFFFTKPAQLRMNIYIQKEGTDFGPYSIEQVKELIQIVAFSQHHQAYHNGQYWIPIPQIPGMSAVSPGTVHISHR